MTIQDRKILQVTNGANLAAILKTFPQADVHTLISEAGQDAWRVEIPLEVFPEEEEDSGSYIMELEEDLKKAREDRDFWRRVAKGQEDPPAEPSFQDQQRRIENEELARSQDSALVLRVQVAKGRYWWITDGDGDEVRGHIEQSQADVESRFIAQHGKPLGGFRRVAGIFAPKDAQKRREEILAEG